VAAPRVVADPEPADAPTVDVVDTATEGDDDGLPVDATEDTAEVGAPKKKRPGIDPASLVLGVGVAGLLGGPLVAGAAILAAAAATQMAKGKKEAPSPAPEGTAPRPQPPRTVEELRDRLLATLHGAPLFRGGEVRPYPKHERVFVVSGAAGTPRLMVGVLAQEPGWLQRATFPQPRFRGYIDDIAPDALLVVWPGGGWTFQRVGGALKRRPDLSFLVNSVP
jgi:hypothetical protein